MNPRWNAIRLGLDRGWSETLQSLRSTQDQTWYVLVAAGVLVYLYINRNDTVQGSDLLRPSVEMPSILGMLVAFGVVIGPAYALAMAREDGTLLRAKAIPYGINGYVTSQVFLHVVTLVLQLLLVLIPGLLLFDDLMVNGLSGWLTVGWVVVLGLVAMMPIGMILGSLVPSTQKMGTWGMMPILVLAAISGIFFPIQNLWGWLQGVAQLFPVYWIGLGMRSAFLPDSAAALELTGSWRTAQTVLVLSAWAIIGLLATPIVLRRMARRQSGSQVQAARDAAVQWVR
jgi:ABC-2 type transport system permease protein